MAEFEKTREFAHLLFDEREIWKAFLVKYPKLWVNYYYDVHVGRGTSPLPTALDYKPGTFERLTQKRIDVVGVTRARCCLFEIRSNPGIEGVSRIFAYRPLFTKQFKKYVRTELAVVGRVANADDYLFARKMKVKIYLI